MAVPLIVPLAIVAVVAIGLGFGFLKTMEAWTDYLDRRGYTHHHVPGYGWTAAEEYPDWEYNIRRVRDEKKWPDKGEAAWVGYAVLLANKYEDRFYPPTELHLYSGKEKSIERAEQKAMQTIANASLQSSDAETETIEVFDDDWAYKIYRNLKYDGSRKNRYEVHILHDGKFIAAFSRNTLPMAIAAAMKLINAKRKKWL